MSEPSLATQQSTGCDVSKDTIAVCDHDTGIASTIQNRPAALKAWVRSLDPARAFVVCETTGGYEGALLEACVAAGVRVHRAHAGKVKAFIASWGGIAKTDEIDARALARYGHERHQKLALWTAPDPTQAELYSMVQRRRDVMHMRTQEKNRAKAPGSKTVQGYIQSLIKAFDDQIKQLDHAIAALAARTHALATRIDKLRTFKGVGLTTAASVIALMPELGHMTRRQAASLAGLAPHPQQSGTKDGYRRTKGGRPELKPVLFMSALVAVRHNPDISTFYQRLIKTKKPIVALTAVMRKLITIFNAILRPEPALQVS